MPPMAPRAVTERSVSLIKSRLERINISISPISLFGINWTRLVPDVVVTRRQNQVTGRLYLMQRAGNAIASHRGDNGCLHGCGHGAMSQREIESVDERLGVG